jgi:hypothetical protein
MGAPAFAAGYAAAPRAAAVLAVVSFVIAGMTLNSRSHVGGRT